MVSESDAELLQRAIPYLRRPETCEAPWEIRDGVLDLLGQGPARRGAEKSFDHASVVWLYDRLRDGPIARIAGLPDFPEEVARVREGLALERGDTVLDLACGHGNFTVALAEAVGPEGLVIGVDLSRPMLTRAAARVQRSRLENVLLVWGDAHDLPIADRSLARINCSGGLHNMPELEGALAELRRVALPGALLTMSMFAAGPRDRRVRLKRRLDRFGAWHFVPLDGLGEQLGALGFGGYQSEMHGNWMGYASARLEAPTEGPVQ